MPFLFVALTIFGSGYSMQPCTQNNEFVNLLYRKGFAIEHQIISDTGESLLLYKNSSDETLWVYRFADGTTCEVKK